MTGKTNLTAVSPISPLPPRFETLPHCNQHVAMAQHKVSCFEISRTFRFAAAVEFNHLADRFCTCQQATKLVDTLGKVVLVLRLREQKRHRKQQLPRATLARNQAV